MTPWLSRKQQISSRQTVIARVMFNLSDITLYIVTMARLNLHNLRLVMTRRLWNGRGDVVILLSPILHFRS